jgi:hypothetical protein
MRYSGKWWTDRAVSEATSVIGKISPSERTAFYDKLKTMYDDLDPKDPAKDPIRRILEDPLAFPPRNISPRNTDIDDVD